MLYVNIKYNFLIKIFILNLNLIFLKKREWRGECGPGPKYNITGHDMLQYNIWQYNT